jgi:hypothetical protein
LGVGKMIKLMGRGLTPTQTVRFIKVIGRRTSLREQAKKVGQIKRNSEVSSNMG